MSEKLSTREDAEDSEDRTWQPYRMFLRIHHVLRGSDFQ